MWLARHHGGEPADGLSPRPVHPGRVAALACLAAAALLSAPALTACGGLPPAQSARSPFPTSGSTAGAEHTSDGHLGDATSPAPSPSARPLKLRGPFPGLLLIADRGNDRMLLVDAHKHIVWQYPRPGHRPTFPFAYDDDAFFVPGYRAIISSQEMQHTIQIVSFPEGRVLWHYGRPGQPGSGRGRLDRPDDAYVLPDGTRTVADIVNQRILFISPRGRVVRTYGTTGVSGHRPPHLLGSPNGDAPTPDAGMLITEISGSWVDAISKSGKLLWSVHTPATYPSDAQMLRKDRILLADYTSPGHVYIIDRKGRVHWHYGPSQGRGRLDHPSLALPIPHGLLAVSDDYRHRVTVISLRSRRIVWQYGHTDLPRARAGYLDTPDGLDFLPARAIRADRRLNALVLAAH